MGQVTRRLSLCPLGRGAPVLIAVGRIAMTCKTCFVNTNICGTATWPFLKIDMRHGLVTGG